MHLLCWLDGPPVNAIIFKTMGRENGSVSVGVTYACEAMVWCGRLEEIVSLCFCVMLVLLCSVIFVCVCVVVSVGLTSRQR